MNEVRNMNEMDIKRRDALIAEFLTEIRAFPATLPIKTYEFELNIDCNVNIIPPLTFDEEWAVRKIEKIKVNVKNTVVSQILHQLNDIKVNDFILRGNVFNVAEKLTCRFFYNDNAWDKDDFDAEDFFDYSNKTEILDVNFADICRLVSISYEQKIMKYYLWDESSLNQLYYFSLGLLTGSDFGLAEYEPDLAEDYTNRNSLYPSLSRHEFLEMLDSAIENIPELACTELPLPFWYDGNFNYDFGIVVGEYVPLSMIDSELIDYIYEDYLKKVKVNEKNYSVEIRAQFDLELDYQFSLNDLSHAENVIASAFENLGSEIHNEFESIIGGDFYTEFSSSSRRRKDNTYKLTGSFSHCFEFEEKDIDGDELIDGAFDNQLEDMKLILNNAIDEVSYDLTISHFVWIDDEVIESYDRNTIKKVTNKCTK